eukprot:3947734-Amphidinium_carterae.1
MGCWTIFSEKLMFPRIFSAFPHFYFWGGFGASGRLGGSQNKLHAAITYKALLMMKHKVAERGDEHSSTSVHKAKQLRPRM